MPVCGHRHRWYRSPEGSDPEGLIKQLLVVLENYPGIYIEVRDNALLAFYPNRDLEDVDGIASLLGIANLLCVTDSGMLPA